MDESSSSGIAQAEKDLAEAQAVLDHAKRAVDAADRAERAAREAAEHVRSLTKVAVMVGAAVTVAAVLVQIARRRSG